MKLIKQSLLLSLLLLATPSFGASNLESGVAEVGKSISESMLQEGKKKIAVIEFSDLNDNVTDLGRFLAEELINELLKNKKDKGYEIVERRQLNKVLKQLKLSSTGLLDPKSMKEVGKILNVDSIVTGSLTDLGNDIKVNARIISVESAKIIDTASTKIPKVGSVARLMGQNRVKVGSGSSSSSSSSATSSKTSSMSHGKYFFENEDILIEFKKLKKTRNMSYLKIIALYTNKTDKPLNIQIYKDKTTMADNNGIRWNNDKNTFVKAETPTTIDADRTLISKMSFHGKNGGFDDSTTFCNIKAYYTINGKDVEVKIYDIPIK